MFLAEPVNFSSNSVDVVETIREYAPITPSVRARYLVMGMVALSPGMRTALAQARFAAVGRLLGDANLLNEHRCARVMGQSKRSREYFDDVSERWAVASTATD